MSDQDPEAERIEDYDQQTALLVEAVVVERALNRRDLDDPLLDRNTMIDNLIRSQWLYEQGLISSELTTSLEKLFFHKHNFFDRFADLLDTLASRMVETVGLERADFFFENYVVQGELLHHISPPALDAFTKACIAHGPLMMTLTDGFRTQQLAREMSEDVLRTAIVDLAEMKTQEAWECLSYACKNPGTTPGATERGIAYVVNADTPRGANKVQALYLNDPSQPDHGVLKGVRVGNSIFAGEKALEEAKDFLDSIDQAQLADPSSASLMTEINGQHILDHLQSTRTALADITQRGAEIPFG